MPSTRHDEHNRFTGEVTPSHVLHFIKKFVSCINLSMFVYVYIPYVHIQRHVIHIQLDTTYRSKMIKDMFDAY